MATDGVITAGAENCLHATARRALAGSLKERGAEAKASIFQDHKIYSAGDQVAAQEFRRDLWDAKKRSRHRQVLNGNQYDLAGPVSLRVGRATPWRPLSCDVRSPLHIGRQHSGRPLPAPRRLSESAARALAASASRRQSPPPVAPAGPRTRTGLGLAPRFKGGAA